eukprot:COSAG05_NODE_433_length_9859_cov_4.471004_4_plen_622_part_00
MDGKDNDHDGKMDCMDPDCLAVPLNARKCAQLAKMKHTVNHMNVQFKIVKLRTTRGSYSGDMIAECKRYGMKPICDHPSYCRTDKAALYLGQKGHLGYPPHRNQDRYKPQGWDQIQKNSYSATSWDGLCYYTGHARGNYALCNVPLSTHAWKTPAQYNPGFMCGKASKVGETHRQCFDGKDNDGDGRSDCQDPDCYKDKRIQQRCRMEANKKVKLGGKNGVPAHLYRFKTTFAHSKSGSYSKIMVSECKKLGMKPICDHPSYCKRDTSALYIGQTHHLSYPPHRNKVQYVPKGFADIEYHSFSANSWKGLCYYTGHARGNYALCNIPMNTHSWKTPAQTNPGFMCGVALGIGGGKTAVDVCENHMFKAADCRRLGCCRYTRGKCKSAIGTRQCVSARGMYVEAYKYKGGPLRSYSKGILSNDWNGMTPIAEHPALQSDMWYSNDKAFVMAVPSFSLTDNFMMRFRCEMRVARPGMYTFQTNSDDGSMLYVDKKLVVNNDGDHDPTVKTGNINLRSGWHKITIVFYEHGGGAKLEVSLKFPGARSFTKLRNSMTRPFQWDSRAKKYDSIPDGCDDWYDGCNSCVRQSALGKTTCTRRQCYRHGKAECRGWARGWSAKGHTGH